MIRFFKPNPRQIEFLASNLTTGVVVGYQIWQNVNNEKKFSHAKEKDNATEQPDYNSKRFSA